MAQKDFGNNSGETQDMSINELNLHGHICQIGGLWPTGSPYYAFIWAYRSVLTDKTPSKCSKFRSNGCQDMSTTDGQ